MNHCDTIGLIYSLICRIVQINRARIEEISIETRANIGQGSK
jgi:hypothetical protein